MTKKEIQLLPDKWLLASIKDTFDEKVKDQEILDYFAAICEDLVTVESFRVPYWLLDSMKNRFSYAYEGSLFEEAKRRNDVKIEVNNRDGDHKIAIFHLEEAGFCKVKLSEGGEMPKKGREGDAAWDLFLAEDIEIPPHSTVSIDTKVCTELPKGYAGMLVPRSSTSKKGIIVHNALIDENYRGPWHGLITNTTDSVFEAKKGDRIYSMLIFPVFNGVLKKAKELSESARGDAWNGSSGK